MVWAVAAERGTLISRSYPGGLHTAQPRSSRTPSALPDTTRVLFKELSRTTPYFLKRLSILETVSSLTHTHIFTTAHAYYTVLILCANIYIIALRSSECLCAVVLVKVGGGDSVVRRRRGSRPTAQTHTQQHLLLAPPSSRKR